MTDKGTEQSNGTTARNIGIALGLGVEFRMALRIIRGTKGLDCNITLRSKSGTSRMTAGGKFPFFALLRTFGVHGPSIQFEADGPDAELAYSIIAAALSGQKVNDLTDQEHVEVQIKGHEPPGFTDEERDLLAGQTYNRRQILSDMPPVAAARWLDWLREDPTRTLPWRDQPLPAEPECPYPYYQQKGGTSYAEKMSIWKGLTREEQDRLEAMGMFEQVNFYCAPPEVRRKMLDEQQGR